MTGPTIIQAFLRNAVVATATVVVAGCASATAMIGPGDELLLEVDCSGPGASMATCHDKADQVCPRGHVVRTERRERRSIVVECVTQS